MIFENLQAMPQFTFVQDSHVTAVIRVTDSDIEADLFRVPARVARALVQDETLTVDMVFPGQRGRNYASRVRGETLPCGGLLLREVGWPIELNGRCNVEVSLLDTDHRTYRISVYLPNTCL